MTSPTSLMVITISRTESRWASIILKDDTNKTDKS